MDGINGDIFLRTFNNFPKVVREICNQCHNRGIFPRRWKTENIQITKSGQVHSTEPSKYRPIKLLIFGGKVLQKLLIRRINHHM